MIPKSGTTLSTFSPYAIPYQSKVVELVRRDWDYDKGTPEILLSGSFGSAKSILMAHLAVTHCLFNPKGRVLLARKALPDLKDTIFKEILEHLEGDLVEGKDYKANHSSAKITFANGAEIISRSWSDKKYKKGRSLKISMLVFEELTENNEEDKQAFDTLKARLRRIPGVKENVLIAATNPDDQEHWVYKYFFDATKPTRFVFKSVTTDNPFLDPIYIQQLKQDLDPLSAQRYIYGEWVSLYKDRIYYAYDRERNFKNIPYRINLNFPVDLMHDFNIGKGKPMSAAVGQRIDSVYHIFKTFRIEGARTLDILEEMEAQGVFNPVYTYRVFGDASGEANDTRSKKTDYDIIRKFLANTAADGQGVRFEMRVPLANPPIRKRHNLMNSLFINELGRVRYYQYAGTEWLDEGWRLTALKKGASFQEDDSIASQHITSAVGYWAVKCEQLAKERAAMVIS
jgi:hypothetical protein